MTQNSEGVFPIANTDDNHRIADIVFIHGLRGESHGTWQYGKKGKPGYFSWPDELGKDIANCGIWTVGYPAGISELGKPGMLMEKRAGNISLKLANAGLGDRPIILIAHSMGGLIVKSLVVDSQILPDEDRKRIAGWIRGIVFCAVPHRGSEFAAAAGILGKFLGGSQPHVKEMVDNAGPLDTLHDKFIEWHKNNQIPIDSYGENIGLLKTRWFLRPLPLGLVVPHYSANPNIVGHVVHYVDDDHLTLVKPPDRQHDVYAGVKRFIQKILSQPPGQGGNPIPKDGTVVADVRCLVDRESPLSEIITMPMPENRLLTVFIDGHIEQRPECFIDRLQLEETFSRYWRGETPDFVEVEWPEEAHKNTEAACANLLELLRFKLDAKEAAPHCIRATLNHAESPRIFISYITEEHFNEQQLDLIERWLRLWHEIAEDSSQDGSGKSILKSPVVLLFCCVYNSHERPPAMAGNGMPETKLYSMRHLIRHDLPVRLIQQKPALLSKELQDVSVPQDVVKWLNKRVLKYRPQWKDRIQDAAIRAEDIFKDSPKLSMNSVLGRLIELKLVD